MEETKCNSHSGLTEGGQRHSCRQQQGLRDEGLNHTCGPSSNADNRPPPSRTNVHELCTMGTSPSQRNSREPLTPGSTCHHLPTHTPPLTPIPILIRPSPNLPQILTLPSHLHYSPLTPQPNTCHHLLPPPPPGTTATTIRDRTLVATDRNSNHRQPQTTLVLNCCNHGTDPLLDTPKGRPQNECRF